MIVLSGCRYRLKASLGGVLRVIHAGSLTGLLATTIVTGAAPAGHEINLKGVKVRLGEPTQVTQTIGRAYFPTLARFSTGELLALYALTEDSNSSAAYVSGFQISGDSGKTWGHRYDIIPEFGSTILYPKKEDGSILLIPHIVYQRTPGDTRNFHGLYSQFEERGRRIVMEPAGLQVLDWPWPVEAVPNKIPQTNWVLNLRFDGNAIRMGNRLIAPMHGTKKGDRFSTLMAVASEDEGRVWRYLSTIADGGILGAFKERELAEGPNESGMVQLANGELMIVFRTGDGAGWHLGRAYSGDGALTWSQPDRLPAVGVEPSVVRCQNGIVALTTGRPGIYLWVSTDERAKSWQSVDIIDHHNRWAPDPTYRISYTTAGGTTDGGRHLHHKDQTTSYTEIVEVTPNRLLLIYDRTPFGWDPTPAASGELNRIFVLPIELTRIPE
ncbi:MAG: exo-alpha-sialidase [Acidobacteria bacterium]|nr:exo-alpha-sialidase [Acidobacteriota bacterium]